MEVDVDGLADAVMAGLREYAGAVAADLKEAAKKTAEECAKELKTASPRQTGSYAKGWRVKKSFENAASARYTVYNKTDYQLTHLLEKGHALRSGGRVIGHVAAIQHIGPAEERAIEAMKKRAREACRP